MRIGVFIPCYNEEKTIKRVVADFSYLNADIIVLDNNSRDRTAEIAAKAGARVIDVSRQGKGNCVQRLIEEDYDCYIMVDGDDTYDSLVAAKMLGLLQKGKADIVVARRMGNVKALHKMGNWLIVRAVRFCFPNKLDDVLSGYRAFNKAAAKSMKIRSSGFEVETEMTIKALEKGLRIRELPSRYNKRPDGSHSKLRSVSDGWIILKTLFGIFRDYRPMQFFSLLAIACLSIATGFGYGIVAEYISSNTITRIPTLVVSLFMLTTAMQLFVAGILASTIAGLRI